MTSPESVAEIAAQFAGSGVRYGIVTASAAGPPVSATVRLEDGGDTVTPLVLSSAGTPAVGSQVALQAGSGRLLLLGTIANPPVPVVYREQFLRATHLWIKARSVTSGLWTYQLDDVADAGRFYQGRRVIASGDGSVQSESEDWATVAYHGDTGLNGALAALAAASATVHLVELEVYRQVFAANGGETVSPVLYGHTYTPGSPPTLATAPAWTGGYGPVPLPPIARGETARVQIPAAWVTAAAAGTITGVGIFSDQVADDLVSWRDSLNVRARIVYTLP